MKQNKDYQSPLCSEIYLMTEGSVMASSTNNDIEDMDYTLGSWGE